MKEPGGKTYLVASIFGFLAGWGVSHVWLDWPFTSIGGLIAVLGALVGVVASEHILESAMRDIILVVLISLLWMLLPAEELPFIFWISVSFTPFVAGLVAGDICGAIVKDSQPIER